MSMFLKIFDERFEVGLEAVPWTPELFDSAIDARRVEAAQFLQQRFQLFPHYAHFGCDLLIYKRIAEIRRSHDSHVEIRQMYCNGLRCEQYRCDAHAGVAELLCALCATRLCCLRQAARLGQRIGGPAELLRAQTAPGWNSEERMTFFLSHRLCPQP